MHRGAYHAFPVSADEYRDGPRPFPAGTTVAWFVGVDYAGDGEPLAVIEPCGNGSTKVGFYDAFNLTGGWVGLNFLGIDVGPIAPMIENHRSGLGWKHFMGADETARARSRLSGSPAGNPAR